MRAHLDAAFSTAAAASAPAAAAAAGSAPRLRDSVRAVAARLSTQVGLRVEEGTPWTVDGAMQPSLQARLIVEAAPPYRLSWVNPAFEALSGEPHPGRHAHARLHHHPPAPPHPCASAPLLSTAVHPAMRPRPAVSPCGHPDPAPGMCWSQLSGAACLDIVCGPAAGTARLEGLEEALAAHARGTATLAFGTAVGSVGGRGWAGEGKSGVAGAGKRLWRSTPAKLRLWLTA